MKIHPSNGHATPTPVAPPGFSALPEPLQLDILSRLDDESLCRAACVSHLWSARSSPAAVWRAVAERHGALRSTQAADTGPPALPGNIEESRKHLAATVDAVVDRLAASEPSVDDWLELARSPYGPFITTLDLTGYEAPGLGEYYLGFDLSKRTELVDEDLHVLAAGCPNLQRLTLDECTSLTSLEGLASLRDLQALSLDGCVELKSLEGIRGLPRLRTLYLNTTPSLTDVQATRDVLASLPALERHKGDGLDRFLGADSVTCPS